MRRDLPGQEGVRTVLGGRHSMYKGPEAGGAECILRS